VTAHQLLERLEVAGLRTFDEQVVGGRVQA
jgi:hypothetical protein